MGDKSNQQKRTRGPANGFGVVERHQYTNAMVADNDTELIESTIYSSMDMLPSLHTTETTAVQALNHTLNKVDVGMAEQNKKLS